MRKLVLAFASVLFIGSQSFAQCCPYVDSVEMIPANPLPTDTLYLVTHVTTPNAGSYLGYTILESGNDIRVEACYYNGMLTVLQSYTDTINLGVKPAGTYNIEFVAYLSSSDVTCTYSDSTQVSDSTTVIDVSGYEPVWAGSVSINPNPVNDGLIYLTTDNAGESLPYQLHNSQGEMLQEGTASQANPIHVSGLKGIYYLSIFKESGVITRKVLIL